MENNPIHLEPGSYAPIGGPNAAGSSQAEKRKEKPAHFDGDREPVSENQPSRSSVTFQVNPESGRVFIHVVDQDSGEIIREIPPEELQRLASALKEMSGRLVNTSA